MSSPVPPVSYVQKGHEVDYTPNAAVVAGDVVVQGNLIGIATHDIPASAQGEVAIDGVFDFPKATTGGSGQDAGTPMFWDPVNLIATQTFAAGLVKIGPQIQASADGDTTCRCRLIPELFNTPASASQAAVATTGSTNSSPYGYTTSAQADGIVTLLNQIRTVLVNHGLMKGGA